MFGPRPILTTSIYNMKQISQIDRFWHMLLFLLLLLLLLLLDAPQGPPQVQGSQHCTQKCLPNPSPASERQRIRLSKQDNTQARQAGTQCRPPKAWSGPGRAWGKPMAGQTSQLAQPSGA